MEYTVFVFLVPAVIFIAFSLWYFIREVKQVYFGYGVPFVPSSDLKLEIFIKNLELKKWQKFLDIGCGDGKILEAVAKKFPQNILVGIENSPNPYQKALKKRAENGLDYQIIKWDFFKEDWSEYDVIHTYMIAYLMPKIWKKIQAECKNGTLFISNSFEIKWVQADKVLEVKNGKYSGKYFMYRVKK